MQTNPNADFEIEADRKRKLVFYTPVSHRAFEWADKHLEGVVKFGRSFMFRADNPRAQKLKGYLKGEEFSVLDRRPTGKTR